MAYPTDPITGKQLRGFAVLSPERRREIAAKAGRATPDHKRAFSVDRDLAASAGIKGGKLAGRGRPRRDVEA